MTNEDNEELTPGEKARVEERMRRDVRAAVGKTVCSMFSNIAARGVPPEVVAGVALDVAVGTLTRAGVSRKDLLKLVDATRAQTRLDAGKSSAQNLVVLPPGTAGVKH